MNAECTLTIPNQLGLHARAAAQFVKCANEFTAEVTITKANTTVNGKSIMGVLMLAAARGQTIIIRTEGTDATPACAALQALVEDGFGEL